MTLLQKIIKYAGFMVFTIEKILQILYSMENCSDEFITAEFAGNEMLDLVERLEKSQWMELHEVFKTISNSFPIITEIQ
jgi:hypothetical protein